MNLAQYDLRTRSGAMCTDPRFLSASDQTLVLAHAMDRPPELAFLRVTNQVAEAGWNPGESANISTGSAAGTPNFYIECKPGLVTGFIWAGSLRVTSQLSNTTTLMTVTSWKVELVAVWIAPLTASV